MDITRRRSMHYKRKHMRQLEETFVNDGNRKSFEAPAY
jgi:hypothetical protein